MATHILEQRPTEASESQPGPLNAIPSLGAAKRGRGRGNLAWRETITQHVPEPWAAARLALQARIAALDIVEA
jgi:hypothetical protein